MALQNPYATALKVDPQKEQQVLAQLRSNPQEMANLGLDPNENFANLKNDQVKYNKVLSYVKGKAYSSPAYGALAGGVTKPEFVQQQTTDYTQTPTAYKIEQAPKLEQQYGIQPLEQRYQTMNELSYSAPATIAEDVKKKGGYDIDALKTANDTSVTNYLDIQNKYIRGEVDRASYINALSQLSVAARSLEKGETGLKTETDKAMGVFNENVQRAKDQYDNAYKRYTDATDLATKGYEEARTEKRTAAEDMYDASKQMLDDARKEEKDYQSAKGKIYNPYTGGYESKPGTGTGTAAMTKMYTEADATRKEIQDGKIDWGQAYNRIAAQYPDANKKIPGDPSGKTYIDAALGGQAVFDGGQYNPEKSTGFAKTGTKQAKKYTEANIPTNLYQEVITNVGGGATLIDLLNAYPDIDPDLVKKLYTANQ